MYYNLDGFGKKVADIRKSLSLTRNQLSKSSLVSIETIRKIETGKTLPKHEILEELSHILKVDLNKIVLDYRLDDFSAFNKTVNSMESKFDRDEYYTLDKELAEFKELLKSTTNTYYRKLIKQLILLIEAVILYKQNKEFQEALNKLVNAMKISTSDFSLSNYKKFVYSDMEIRILMNIALLLKRQNSLEDSLKLMEFCIGIINYNSEIYPKLCHNLSSVYGLLDDYKNSLKYADLGIEYCRTNRNFNGLNLLYFNKGIAEHNLGYDGYLVSLNKSISFCDILGQDKLKEVIIDKCKKIFNITL